MDSKYVGIKLVIVVIVIILRLVSRGRLLIQNTGTVFSGTNSAASDITRMASVKLKTPSGGILTGFITLLC